MAINAVGLHPGLSEGGSAWAEALAFVDFALADASARIGSGHALENSAAVAGAPPPGARGGSVRSGLLLPGPPVATASEPVASVIHSCSNGADRCASAEPAASLRAGSGDLPPSPAVEMLVHAEDVVSSLAPFRQHWSQEELRRMVQLRQAATPVDPRRTPSPPPVATPPPHALSSDGGAGPRPGAGGRATAAAARPCSSSPPPSAPFSASAHARSAQLSPFSPSSSMFSPRLGTSRSSLGGLGVASLESVRQSEVEASMLDFLEQRPGALRLLNGALREWTGLSGSNGLQAATALALELLPSCCGVAAATRGDGFGADGTDGHFSDWARLLLWQEQEIARLQSDNAVWRTKLGVQEKLPADTSKITPEQRELCRLHQEVSAHRQCICSLLDCPAGQSSIAGHRDFGEELLRHDVRALADALLDEVRRLRLQHQARHAAALEARRGAQVRAVVASCDQLLSEKAKLAAEDALEEERRKAVSDERQSYASSLLLRRLATGGSAAPPQRGPATVGTSGAAATLQGVPVRSASAMHLGGGCGGGGASPCISGPVAAAAGGGGASLPWPSLPPSSQPGPSTTGLRPWWSHRSEARAAPAGRTAQQAVSGAPDAEPRFDAYSVHGSVVGARGGGGPVLGSARGSHRSIGSPASLGRGGGGTRGGARTMSVGRCG
mmetsp:Transcript_43241/g.123694  ORF Transcript_43241/g.123694 Transcript_43241/m.123694 type:complete len:669 (+) Transcript_43241:74-2080(+)